MKVIARGRAAGKTTDLIKESYETGAYILVHHHSQADAIKRQAEMMGMESMPYPITLDDLRRNASMYHMIKGILIDNAELILRSMIPVPINTITVTSNEEHWTMQAFKEKYEKELHRLESRSDIGTSAYLQGQRNMAKQLVEDIEERQIKTYYGGVNPND